MTIREKRERFRRELHGEIALCGKTLEEALSVDYDPEHRVRQRLSLWFSNFGLMISGSKFRGRIVKGG